MLCTYKSQFFVAKTCLNVETIMFDVRQDVVYDTPMQTYTHYERRDVK